MNYESQEQFLADMGAGAEAQAEAEHYAILEKEANTVNYNELCGMDKFRKILLREVANEVRGGSCKMPQILVLIERVYNNFDFTDLHGTCKVGDWVKPKE